jgi:hypothetical protein
VRYGHPDSQERVVEAIDLAMRAAALALFNQMVRDSFTVLPVASGHFRIAARFVDNHTSGLRAGDATHLPG